MDMNCADCGTGISTGIFADRGQKPHSRHYNLCKACGNKLEEAQHSGRHAVSENSSNNKTPSFGGLLLVTVEKIPEGMEPIGIARGSTARARNAIADFGAGLKNVVGGEVVSYTKLIADAREQALQRLGVDASRMGADMVVGVRFTSTTVDTGVSEILAYGTALKKMKMEAEDG